MEFNIDNIDIQNNFYDSMVKQTAKNYDDMIFEFLTENGYKIDKPYNVKQLKEIKTELAKQDKFVDTLQYTEFEDNNCKTYNYILPFFNSISNPLSEEEKQQILEEYLENKKENK
jgi:hypothetical protein